MSNDDHSGANIYVERSYRGHLACEYLLRIEGKCNRLVSLGEENALDRDSAEPGMQDSTVADGRVLRIGITNSSICS